MSKKLLIALFCLIGIMCYARVKILKGVNYKDAILFQPKDKIGDELNEHSLFLSAEKGTKLLFPKSGIVKSFSIGCLYSLNYSRGGNLEFNMSFDLQKQEVVKALKGVPTKYFNASISIETNKGMKYTIRGFVPTKMFKTGQKVEEGDEFGLISYAYHKIEKPNIKISLTKGGNRISPLLLFNNEPLSISDIQVEDETKELISIEQMKNAVDILDQSLQEGHPGLYDYLSNRKYKSMLKQIRQSISKSLTCDEFRILLMPLINAIGDNHLTLITLNKRIMPVFPSILFGLNKTKVEVVNVFEQFKPYLGKEVVSINGEKSNKVVEKLKPYIWGDDGYIQSTKDEELLLNMAPIYSQVYGLKVGDSIQLEFENNEILTVKCKQLERSDRYYPFPVIKRTKKNIMTKMLNNSVALLKIKSFNLLDTDKDLIRKFIAELQKQNCENLIIDLRGNKGGEGFPLFSMLYDKPYKSMEYSEVKNVRFDFFKYSNNYTVKDCLFTDYSKGDQLYRKVSKSLTEPNQTINYNRKIYVLIDANSKSESVRFASLVHKYKRGLIIGRESSTCYHQMNAVKFAKVDLAKTGLVLRIPLVKCVLNKYKDTKIPFGRGVIPDHIVELSLEDYFTDKDRILHTTLQLIRMNKK
jgi:ribonuclease HII